MIDIHLIREEYALVKKNYEKRKDPDLLKRLAQVKEYDEEWRKAEQKKQELVAEKNRLSKSINEAKKQGKDIKPILAKVSEYQEKVRNAEIISEDLRLRSVNGLKRLPNLLHESVPYGKDDSENKEVRAWGKKTKPTFELLAHAAFAEKLDIADFDRARKISGTGYYILKGDLVRLHQALINFSLDRLVKKGFTPIEPPLMLRREPYEGVTDLSDFEKVMYKIDQDDAYLIATSEHPLCAMHMNEVIPEEQLPITYVGLSPCFRREVGAHGMDEKGLFRTHQFWKVEQIVICKPEDSETWHEKIIKNAEELFEALELPYHIVNICTGDMGTVAAKKYDLEVWLPRTQQYKEAVSGSNCTDYQARRLNLKYGAQGGEKRYVHTLNSTGIALSRVMVAILENYQNEDGTLSIPKVLQPYMGKQKLIKAAKK